MQFRSNAASVRTGQRNTSTMCVGTVRPGVTQEVRWSGKNTETQWHSHRPARRPRAGPLARSGLRQTPPEVRELDRRPTGLASSSPSSWGSGKARCIVYLYRRDFPCILRATLSRRGIFILQMNKLGLKEVTGDLTTNGVNKQ